MGGRLGESERAMERVLNARGFVRATTLGDLYANDNVGESEWKWRRRERLLAEETDTEYDEHGEDR